jgi:hypothetical protein
LGIAKGRYKTIIDNTFYYKDNNRMQTIAQRKIEKLKNEGFNYVGQTHGLYSFKKWSNLYKYLLRNNFCMVDLILDNVRVECGARAGRSLREGYQLLVFQKSANNL